MIVSAKLAVELLDRIGVAEGRNSEVYLAHDPQLDADIVVKKLSKASYASIADYFAEAKRLYDARHPNVAEVKYACEDADSVYLAMPYYARGSVAAILDERRLTIREIVKYGLDILNGLHHIHTKRMVHFDVKPSNVLIDHSGKAALADFGVARYLRVTGLATADRLYFLHWPPEYLLARDLPLTADAYQADLTLYRMCVGSGALEEQAKGKEQEELVSLIQAGRFPDRQMFPLHIPMRLKRVVRKALAVDPGDRFATIFDMLIALAEVNQWLDWECLRDPIDGTWTWKLVAGGQCRTVILTASGDAWSVVAATSYEESGVTRRQRALCGDGVTWGRARTLVQRGLTEMERLR